MLQRAASNAYSWWWASHIRTKQSKWLEQSLQDMEEKVQSMLKLIDEDGDSFVKRANMFYKRRPEIISSVEEAYKSFRALADRYDLLSKELQTANHTIATVFPEQVQFMDDDDESPSLKIPRNTHILQPPNASKIPNPPIKDIKSLITTASKQLKDTKASRETENRDRNVATSGLTKEQALDEIDKLQKDILALQTVKEFVKSSYDSSLAKYWEIESRITEMQQRVCGFQDEFNIDTVIEDDEARTLMAEAALKSCQEILTQLQDKQESSEREAREEYKKIEAARELLDSLKHKYLKDNNDKNESVVKTGEPRSETTDMSDVIQENKETEPLQEIETEPLQEKSKQNTDSCSMTFISVTELAEKIDNLVNKVINLETAVSSQTVLITTLKTESDMLHAQIRSLEEEKETLVTDSQKLKSKLKEMEEKLAKIENMNKSVEIQNSNLQSNFAEARLSLGHLSERVSSVKPDEEVEEKEKDVVEEKEIVEEMKKDASLLQQKLEENGAIEKDVTIQCAKSSKTQEKEDVKAVCVNEQKMAKKSVTFLDQQPKELASVDNSIDLANGEAKSIICLNQKLKELDPVDHSIELVNSEAKSVTFLDQKQKELAPTDYSIDLANGEAKSVTYIDQKPKELAPVDHSIHLVNGEAKRDTGKEEEMNWQQMLLNGIEDREKILLKEYTAILRNYKDVKKKLNDMEKKERDSQFDIIFKVKAQKKAILKRDEEIQQLRQKLNTDEVDISEVPTSIEEGETELDHIGNNPSTSIVDEKFRCDIDAILDDNLDFWLRFSTIFHQIKKFKTEVQDLQDEIEKIEEKKLKDGHISSQTKSEVRPIYKHLREKQRELTVWLEQSSSLKDELKRRFNALCNIQDDITKTLKEGDEEEIKFDSHQAAIFQGEILNMKQENKKVSEELRAGFDHVSLLQFDVDKTLVKLSEEFGISSDQPDLKHAMSRSRIPLRSFIFGRKGRKHSIFSKTRS